MGGTGHRRVGRRARGNLKIESRTTSGAGIRHALRRAVRLSAARRVPAGTDLKERADRELTPGGSPSPSSFERRDRRVSPPSRSARAEVAGVSFSRRAASLLPPRGAAFSHPSPPQQRLGALAPRPAAALAAACSSSSTGCSTACPILSSSRPCTHPPPVPVAPHRRLARTVALDSAAPPSSEPSPPSARLARPRRARARIRTYSSRTTGCPVVARTHPLTTAFTPAGRRSRAFEHPASADGFVVARLVPPSRRPQFTPEDHVSSSSAPPSPRRARSNVRRASCVVPAVVADSAPEDPAALDAASTSAVARGITLARYSVAARVSQRDTWHPRVRLYPRTHQASWAWREVVRTPP